MPSGFQMKRYLILLDDLWVHDIELYDVMTCAI